MAIQRVQIAVSFSYETSVYVASSSGGAVTNNQVVTNPAVGSTVTIIDRNTSNPATVYAGLVGSSTIASVVTDAGGNVPGFVVEGSYSITAASAGSFTGATVNWEAVRGDGVENYYPGSVNLTALATAVAQALVPTGTLLSFGGSSAPAGYLLCNGAVVSQTTYAALFGVIGTAFNSGAEGAGNFRLPDTRQRFLLGLATSGTGSTLGVLGATGSIDHTHSVATHTHTIPSLGVLATVPAHTHPLGNSGGVQIGWIGFGGGASFIVGDVFGGSASFSTTTFVGGSDGGTFHGANPYSAIPLCGTTQSGGGVTIGGATSTGTTGVGGPSATGATNPPLLPVNYIIKT